MEVNEVNISEMKEVRELGTKVLGLADFDAIESAWKAILEEEANTAANTDAEEEGSETVDNATRFIEYCKSEVAKRITAADALGTDGIIVNFTGFDLNVLNEEGIVAETARQAAFFDAIINWKKQMSIKHLYQRGSPKYYK